MKKETTKREILELPMDSIIADPDQPRKLFSEEELSGLADSIKTHGLLQPITVRELNGDGEKWMILAGERRFRAHQLLKRNTIPAIVREVKHTEIADLQAMENMSRSDMTPTEEAWAVDRGIRSGRSYNDLAKSFGRSASSLEDLHTILKLPEPILKRVDDGAYPLGIAKMLAKFPARLHVEAYEKTQGMTTEEAKKVLQIFSIEQKQMDIFTLSPDEVKARNDIGNQLWELKAAANTFLAHTLDSLRVLKEPDVKALGEIRDRIDALIQKLAVEPPKDDKPKSEPKVYDVAILQPLCDRWWKEGERLQDLARPLGITWRQLLGQFWSTGLVPRPKRGQKTEDFMAAYNAANPHNQKKG